MKKRVLIAVLNWGLGHATRSETIISEVLSANCDVFLASSGSALSYLKNRFPSLPAHPLPDKEVLYTQKSALPGLIKRGLYQSGINKKQKIWTDAFIADNGITHIISDNVYGVWSARIPSALISHQLGLLSPVFKNAINRRLAKWINNFSEVWVPDVAGSDSIAGKMLINNHLETEVQFLGNCSRFSETTGLEKTIDYLAVLSGAEPLRTFLERQILDVFSRLEGKKVLLRGKESSPQKELGTDIIGMANSDQMRDLILKSELVICRSGFTSVSDLLKLNAKALLIPTPGQPEQEYLAKRCRDKNWFDYTIQKKLTPDVARKAFSKRVSETKPTSVWNGSAILEKFLT
ncbi:MAG: glycosyltransferase [Cryomorphaceae bacterium]